MPIGCIPALPGNCMAMPPDKQGIRTITVARDGKISGSMAFHTVPDLRERGFATVKGTLVDASNRPVPHMRIGDDRVELWDSDPMPVQELSAATTDDEGKFQFSVRAGIKHKRFISSPDYKGQGNEFIPHANETVTINLVGEPLPIVAWITGKVVDPTGDPIEAAEVEAGRDSALTGADGKFRLPQRVGDEQVNLRISKRSFGYRDWTSVIPGPDGEELKFVLYPAGQRPRRTGPARPMDSQLLLNHPAPPLLAESWVGLTGAAPQLEAGTKLLMFTSTFDNRHHFAGTIKDWPTKLDQNAARLGAQPVVIFTPTTHESEIRHLLKDMNLQAAIGLDQFVPYGEFYNGATRLAYGGQRPTQVFLIRADGTVESDDFDLEQGK